MTYPIVLAHGVCRFDFFWGDFLSTDNNDDPKIDLLHYFKGVRTMFMSKGFAAFHSKVSWAADVNTRAEDLKRNILAVLQQTSAAKVNIIAHSMGGLDARHMMFNDRGQGVIHQRVASLTTISTPHWGTPFADCGLENLPAIVSLASKVGLDLHALPDLTVPACTAFNQDPEVQQFEHACDGPILFQTYAGRQHMLGVFDPLKVPFHIIEKVEGENDGLVSVKSATWQDRFYKGTLDETDHLNELGWYDFAQHWVHESPDKVLARIHEFYAGIAGGLP
jgi:triacylglycerol lipase